MRFRLAPRSISLNFQRISQISDGPTAKRMKTDQYCQWQRCKHIELEQCLACFRVAHVCDSWVSCYYRSDVPTNSVNSQSTEGGWL